MIIEYRLRHDDGQSEEICVREYPATPVSNQGDYIILDGESRLVELVEQRLTRSDDPSPDKATVWLTCTGREFFNECEFDCGIENYPDWHQEKLGIGSHRSTDSADSESGGDR